MVTDANGTPLAAEVSPGQSHESTRFEETMNAVRVPQPVGRPRQRPEGVAGDKGYSCGRIRDWLKARRRKRSDEAKLPAEAMAPMVESLAGSGTLETRHGENAAPGIIESVGPRSAHSTGSTESQWGYEGVWAGWTFA